MTQLNDYELERQRNIERNRELLAQLELPAAVSALGSVGGGGGAATPAPKARPKKKRDNKARVVKPDRPTRASSRLRGLEPPPFEITEDDTLSGTNEGGGNTNTVVDPELWDGRLLSGDEYFDEEVRKNAIRVDGHYAGWINPELVEKYHFEASAAEAWEKNGGGTFSFKDPTGTGKKKGGGRFNAKAAAQAMFKKNPNMYFYRHNEPGVEQWTGDWTEEEKKLFLEVAQKHGCGDKWGLFASYIPHRVGYQCSNFYRSEILPSGLIFDDNYKYTPSGRPIYVGNHRARG